MGKKLTIEYVKMEFGREGYTLLEDEYIGSGIKLNYICSKGHKNSIRWNSWQQGSRCPICIGNNIKLELDFITQEFKKEGYILLSD